MTTNKAKVGRPRGDNHVRDKLINAARNLFIERDYAQVTVRDVAKLANTDPGMIRYYFGNKEQLFSAMLQETATPVIEQLHQSQQAMQPDSPAQLLQTYYGVMENHPHFPRLMFRLAGLDQNNPENQAVLGAFNRIVQLGNMMMFEQLQRQGVLREDVDAQCAQLSFFAMMVFPFLIPDNILNSFGIELTPAFLRKLAQQNTNLIHRGLMPIKEESNE
ncbi:TetR/AcrR family transcriptional regulator [Shewanella waksmanii]|uniref:TetR/AcrR family transcriptional regulator n=1 Tax=Shewanella waksmanii TaxID=213783 RepID=UPI003735897F